MSVTPDFTGQIYKDSATGNLWRANSLTAGDWTLELQNAQMKWLPTSVNLTESFGIQSQAGTVAPTEMTFLQTEFIQDVIINSTSVTAIRFPNLVNVDPDYWWGASLKVDSCTAMTVLELPLLVKLGSGSLEGNACTSLVTLDLPSLTTVAERVSFASCSSLTTVSCPSYLPTNGKHQIFQTCNLSAASVNHILARCVANPGYVSGEVHLNDGTNASPTGQGVTDKATLIGRGVVVTTN